MLNCLSKIYEQILAARILEGLKLSPDQFGFVKGKSTTQALKKLKRIYELNMQAPLHHRNILCIIGLDIKNAFNSLRWSDIIVALESKNVAPYITQSMKSYFSDRTIKYSDISFQVSSGVAQGSVLAAIHWKITFDYIVRLRTISRSDKIVHADDLLIILQCYSKSSLRNNSFRITRQYIKELKKLSLKIAVPKTNAVIISGSADDRRNATVLVGDTEIPISKSMRHLGFQVGKLNFIKVS